MSCNVLSVRNSHTLLFRTQPPLCCTKTLVGLFSCVLDFLSEIRRWVLVVSPSSGSDADSGSASAGLSIVDLWALNRLGLECSRVLGVWVAEDPESLPQRFLEALPVLLTLSAGEEVRLIADL